MTDCPPGYTGHQYAMSGIAIVMTAPGRSARQVDWLVGVGLVTFTVSAISVASSVVTTTAVVATVVATGATACSIATGSAGCSVTGAIGAAASTPATGATGVVGGDDWRAGTATLGRVVVVVVVTRDGVGVDRRGRGRVGRARHEESTGDDRHGEAREGGSVKCLIASAWNPHRPCPSGFHGPDEVSRPWYGVGWVRGSSSLDERPFGSSGSVLPSRRPT